MNAQQYHGRVSFRRFPSLGTRTKLKSVLLSQLLLALVSTLSLRALSYEPTELTPPKPLHEFRGAWVATVKNADWPSRPGLSSAEQKAELIAILDSAAELHLNAIIFQVRPMCDAMYPSSIEPWTEFLTGTMGQSPKPFYDPLAFVVAEAHKRGLELHAWFNPYRAGFLPPKSPFAGNHISKTRPDLVREYGKHLWLDPGEPAVQEYSLSVVMDVVKRYDVDGIHFDDYFYPYFERGPDKKVLAFPDETSWKKSGASGKLSREDWRRENVNMFVERVARAIKAVKPRVKFGIAPFGIWRPGNPPQIKGMDAYDELYCDSRKWLASGWVDYLAPQLYWSIEAKGQSFPVLLNWWDEHNPQQRHIWPGLDTTKVGEKRKPEEIVAQIRLANQQPVSGGHVHWNMRSLTRSPELQTALERGPYAEPALVPQCRWLDNAAPSKPQVTAASAKGSTVNLSLQSATNEPAFLWLVQVRSNDKWTTQILPGNQRSLRLRTAADAVAISAVDRMGNVSLPVGLRPR
jgi:uncharacterized lipoprotein YddW (UPF0748 family)